MDALRKRIAELEAELQLARRNLGKLPSEHDSDLTVDFALHAMVLVNRAGEIVQINSQAERLFGYAVDELVGKTIEVAEDASRRSAHQRRQELARRFSQLSDAEKEVLKQVLQGVANKRIASALGISRRTVEDRRARLMQKLEVETLVDLVRLAVEAGFISE